MGLDIVFSTKDKKAFYTVQKKVSEGFVKCLGCCFKMLFKLTDESSDQLMWVSTSSILENTRNSTSSLIARRCIPSKEEPLKVSEVKSSNGVSFIKCNEEDKNFLQFGYWERSLPNELCAFVFDNKQILQLTFRKSSSGTDYSIKTPSLGFDVSKAVGAPIILSSEKPDRNRVVGIVDIKADDTLYPLFFNPRMFLTGNVPSPSEGSVLEEREIEDNGEEKTSVPVIGTQIDEQVNKESDVKTHSPLVVAGGSKKKDENVKKDSQPIQVSVGQDGEENVKNGTQIDEQVDNMSIDKTDSPFVVAGISQNVENKQDTRQLAGGQANTSALRLPPQSNSTCLKGKTLVQSPFIYKLFKELKYLLDPQRDLRGDYRDLADQFGYNYQTILFLKTRDSPTEAILNQEMASCTFLALCTKLEDMERYDAVDIVNNYTKEYCSCHQCKP